MDKAVMEVEKLEINIYVGKFVQWNKTTTMLKAIKEDKSIENSLWF